MRLQRRPKLPANSLSLMAAIDIKAIYIASIRVSKAKKGVSIHREEGIAICPSRAEGIGKR